MFEWKAGALHLEMSSWRAHGSSVLVCHSLLRFLLSTVLHHSSSPPSLFLSQHTHTHTRCSVPPSCLSSFDFVLPCHAVALLFLSAFMTFSISSFLVPLLAVFASPPNDVTVEEPRSSSPAKQFIDRSYYETFYIQNSWHTRTLGSTENASKLINGILKDVRSGLKSTR